MKSMNLFFAAMVIVLFPSCSKYQFAYLNSNLQRNNEQEFIQENDTFKVQYSFWGEDCPITIQINNKLSEPLYIDWKKSAIVHNDQRICLWEDLSVLNGTTNEFEYKWTKNITTSQGNINGTIYRNEQISFIPPQSYVRVTPVSLKKEFFSLSANDSMSHVNYNANQSTVQVKRYYYRKENTPMAFRCFLTFSTKEDFSNTKYTDNQFWITDIVSSHTNLPIAKADKFYIKKTTGFGRFMGCTTILALVAVPVILGVNATTPD